MVGVILHQELYRTGTAISDASNLYTAAGKLKQRIQRQRIIFEGKGPNGPPLGPFSL